MTTNREQVARWCAHESGDECPAGNEYLDCLANQEIRWRCRCSEYDALFLAAIKDKLISERHFYDAFYNKREWIVSVGKGGYDGKTELEAAMNAVLAMEGKG